MITGGEREQAGCHEERGCSARHPGSHNLNRLECRHTRTLPPDMTWPSYYGPENIQHNKLKYNVILKQRIFVEFDVKQTLFSQCDHINILKVVKNNNNITSVFSLVKNITNQNISISFNVKHKKVFGCLTHNETLLFYNN